MESKVDRVHKMSHLLNLTIAHVNEAYNSYGNLWLPNKTSPTSVKICIGKGKLTLKVNGIHHTMTAEEVEQWESKVFWIGLERVRLWK